MRGNSFLGYTCLMGRRLCLWRVRAVQGSEVDGGAACCLLMHLRRHMSERPQEVRAHARGGHTGSCFVVVPCQERTIVKGSRLCFLSEALFTPALSVISDLSFCTSHCWPAAKHLSCSSCIFHIVPYLHTVGTIVATLECLLSELD